MPYKDPEQKRAYRIEYRKNGPKRTIRIPKVQCPKGHDFTPENTYINPKGYKICRICARKAVKDHTERKKRRIEKNGRIEPWKW